MKDSVSREDLRRVERAKRRVGLAVGGIVFLALLALAAMIALFLPYSPLQIYSYEPLKSEVCPGEVVATRVEYRAKVGSDAPGAPSIRQVEVDPAWIAEDVPSLMRGQRIEGPEATLAGEKIAPGRHSIISSVLRTAPSEPGQWRLETTLTVRGNAYGVPHIQTITTLADKSTTVLGGEECVASDSSAGEGGI